MNDQSLDKAWYFYTKKLASIAQDKGEVVVLGRWGRWKRWMQETERVEEEMEEREECDIYRRQ